MKNIFLIIVVTALLTSIGWYKYAERTAEYYDTLYVTAKRDLQDAQCKMHGGIVRHYNQCLVGYDTFYRNTEWASSVSEGWQWFSAKTGENF